MANSRANTVIIALARAEAPAGDREALIETACEMIIDAGRGGAHLLILPAALTRDIIISSAAADRLAPRRK